MRTFKSEEELWDQNEKLEQYFLRDVSSKRVLSVMYLTHLRTDGLRSAAFEISKPIVDEFRLPKETNFWVYLVN